MKKKNIVYLISFFSACVLSFLVMLLKNIFSSHTAKEYYSILSDSFFVSGAVLFCFGFLIIASNQGVFDMLTYGIRKIFDVLRRDVSKVKYHTYYDYKEAKKDKKSGFIHLIITGAAFMVIGGVFLVLYLNVA